jgi:hypothetical protein
LSKERALRRAEREAAAQAARAARQRAVRRRARRRAAIRRLTPRLPDRRTGKLFARRSRGERTAIAIGVLLALLPIWAYVDSLLARISLTALVAVATPIVVLLILDRRI